MKHEDTSKDFFTRYALAVVEIERINKELMIRKEDAIGQDHLMSVLLDKLIKTQSLLREFVEAKWPRGVVGKDKHGHPVDGEGEARIRARELLGMDKNVVSSPASPAKCECSDGPYHYESCPLFTGRNPFAEFGAALSPQNGGKR